MIQYIEDSLYSGLDVTTGNVMFVFTWYNGRQ